MVRRATGCIITAATLRHTASPHATQKSEIHMETASSLLVRIQPPTTFDTAHWFPGSLMVK
jgi:hypothetical protein